MYNNSNASPVVRVINKGRYVYKIYVGISQQKHRCRLENNIVMHRKSEVN
jgi:hypothetical protein